MFVIIFFVLFLIVVVFVIFNVFLCISIDYRLSHYVVAGACVVISVLVDAVSTGFSLIANLKNNNIINEQFFKISSQVFYSFRVVNEDDDEKKETKIEFSINFQTISSVKNVKY